MVAVGFNCGDRHAERAALYRLWPSKRHGTTLISIRVTRHGLAMAKPCPDCAALCQENRVSRVYYSTANGLELM